MSVWTDPLDEHDGAGRPPAFLADPQFFELLREGVLPELLYRRASERRLDAWVTADDRGQEALSLAMVLQHGFPELHDWDVRIVATLRDPEALEAAREGLYSELDLLRGLPEELRARFEPEGSGFRIDPDLHETCHFRVMDFERTWPPMPGFDLILARGVGDWFSADVSEEHRRRFEARLNPGGFLFFSSRGRRLRAPGGEELGLRCA